MHILEGKALRYALDEKSRVVSVYNRLTAHEYVYMPGELWKLIYQEGRGPRSRYTPRTRTLFLPRSPAG